MVEVHDEVENARAFWRHLSHNDPASMSCRACKVVGVKFFAILESVEYGLDPELMDCSAKRRSVGATVNIKKDS